MCGSEGSDAQNRSEKKPPKDRMHRVTPSKIKGHVNSMPTETAQLERLQHNNQPNITKGVSIGTAEILLRDLADVGV